MDVSLEDYARQQGKFRSRGGNTNRLPVSARLGGRGRGKQLPSAQARTIASAPFDARQKLNKKNVPAFKSPPKLQDARQKLSQKTKFTDARVRIENKKAEKKGGTQDMRIKINNAKARKGLQLKQGIASNDDNTQVTVTSKGRMLTKPGGGVQDINGSLVKTVGTPTTFVGRTLKQQQMAGSVQLQRDNMIKVTTVQKPTVPSYVESAGLLSGTVQVANEYYRPPAVRRPPPVRVQVPVVEPPQPPVLHVTQRLAATSYIPQILPEHFSDVEADAAPPMLRQTVHQTVAPAIQQHAAFGGTLVTSSLRSAPLTTSRIRAQQHTPHVTTIDEGPTKEFRLQITNLHPVVTEEDVVELFGAIGDLKRARLIRQGFAEVVYTQWEQANLALKKYNMRELDGIPMEVRLADGVPKKKPPPIRPPSPKVQTIKEEPMDDSPAPPSSSQKSSSQTYEPLKLFKGNSKAASTPESEVNVAAVHKALFKIKDSGPTKPVTFTVKI